MTTSTLSFDGALGHRLSAQMDLPVGEPRAYALFAHCFTCSRDLHPVVRMSQALNEAGVAVLRFDFTGLGESGGDVAETHLSSNVDDLVAAARYMAEAWQAPRLLVGHSLGGAAAILAASRLASVEAVVTLGAPSQAAHVLAHLEGEKERIREKGAAEVDLGGRPFRVGTDFLDDVTETRLKEALAGLGKPLLVLHAPQDEVVDVEHAERILGATGHPKSFVALDGADHLLTDPAQARYAAQVTAAWASRYLGLDLLAPPGPPPEDAPGEPRSHLEPNAGALRVRTGAEGYRTEAGVRKHRFVLDEPVELGGTDEGPTPYEALWAGLAACTSITLRMYADRKEWPLEGVEVEIRQKKEDGKDQVVRELHLSGALDAEQRARLVEIADRCPVHRTLEAGVEIRTELAGEG